MIDYLIDSDLEYIRCFSEELEKEQILRFSDCKLEEMYANNITVLKESFSNENMVKIINKEIKERKKAHKRFLVVELQGRITKDVLRAIKIKPTLISELDYMIIDTKKYKGLKCNPDCQFIKVNSEDEYKKLVDFSILDNAPYMGKAFSRDRINRKVLVYKEKNKGIYSYLCYNNNIAVGSCEMFIKGKIAKIEDFGVLQSYQKKGYGTTMIKHLLMEANEKGLTFAYVVTDSNDTARNMYKKCGFLKVGEKTQILYSFS